MRGLFYRGRHHVRTAPRPADGGLVTVDTIASRITRERFEANMRQLRALARVGSLRIPIIPDFRPLDPMPSIALATYGRQLARAKSDGLGALAI